MRRLILLLVAAVAPLAAESLTADEIMERVGCNQERSQSMRTAFVHDQVVQVRLHRGNRKLAREERYRYRVVPTPQGIQKHRVEFSGRYADKHGRLISYDKPGYEYKEMDIDGELAEDLADDLANDEKSRDGVSHDLFPLTTAEQKHYRFRLEGIQQYRGRDVYRITFRFKDKNKPWAGEALIDTSEFQPVLVTSRLARRIPFVIQTLLGTNIKQFGFKVSYERFEDGIWFPVAYGGEFELRAVFFYKRIVSLSMINSGFQRSDVASRIEYDIE
jgi:hypothetical protein